MSGQIDNNQSKLSIGFLNKSLCTRCGTCSGACPGGLIQPGDDFYPTITPQAQGRIPEMAAVCPGASVNFKTLSKIVFGSNDDSSFDGITRLTYVGYAKDEAIRSGGAGGGVVTGLLWDLLKHGEVEGCLVTRMKPETPWIGESFIARTYDDLLRSQGSKYSVVPHNAILSKIGDLPGRFAYAGLPCQIHGLRLLCEEQPIFKEKIALIVGLFCGGAFEPYMVPELMQAKGVRKEELKDFQFRGGDWPGKMRSILKNGAIKDMHYSDYKDGAYNYLNFLYSPTRCLTCIDGSSQFADISVGDVWTRDKLGNYVYREHSRIFARTERGEVALKRALERDTICAHDVTQNPHYKTHKAHTARKGTLAPIRIARMEDKGIPVPIYDRPEPCDITSSERIKERVITAVHFLSKHYWFRYPLLKLLVSPASIPLIWIRRLLKKRKYRAK